MVEISWLGVILAALSSMVVGSIWYSSKVFGATWMKLVGLTEEKAQKGAVKALSLTLLASFFTAYILAHVTFLSHHFFNNSYLQDALSTAFWMWLGFTGARILTHDLFEHRPTKLTLITISHELVTLLVMGLVIGLFQP